MSPQEQETRTAINTLVKEAYLNSAEKGFHDGEAGIPQNLIAAQKLCLIHSEVSEALEVLRESKESPANVWYTPDGKPEGYGAELADVVIRVFDEAGRAGIHDFGALLIEKMKYNASRIRKHGKAF